MQGHTKHQSNHNQPNNQSFIFVLRHGLRKVFLGLYSYLKSFSSRIRHGVALPLPWRSRTFKPKINYYISNNRRIRIAGISSAFVLALLTIATLAPLTHNTEYTGAIGTASETVLTLTTSNYPILDLAVNSSSGTFSETSSGNGQGSFTVTTTNYTGYTLSISNSDSDTNLTASDVTGNPTIASIPTGSSLTASQFNNATYNGKWGYKPSKYYDTSTSTVVDNSSTSTGVYLPSPTTTATTLNITNCANGKSNGSNTCPDAVDTYTIDLAARLEYTQDSGNYTNTFILTAVGNPIDYTVNYNGTGADSGTTPGVAEDETNLTYITLSSITPTKDGYTFKGWCTVDTGTDGTNACTGTTYQPGDQYPINQTTQNVATLYAMWEVDAVNMQDLDPTLCTTTASLAVKDTRDGKTYTVQRLADGKCWMTSNLNLAGGTALYSDDSNVADANTKASGNPYYTLPASTAISSGTSVPNDQFSSDTGEYVFNTGNATTTCSSSTPCNSYYSWLAATAGGKDSSGNAVSTNGYNAAYSICPKGWRLPTSTTSNASATTSPNWKTGDFYALATAYGANLESNYYQSSGTFYNNAGPGTTPNFLLAGRYYSGSFYGGGSGGDYWSSTSNSGTSAYRLYFNSSYVDSANSYYRSYGFSVRCVLDDSMQTITSSSLASIMPNDGDSTTLRDARDNQTYTVAKINGNYWMTRNIAIGCAGTGSTYSATISSKSLTSSNSNVNSSWSTPTALLSTSANSSETSGHTTAAMQCHATYGGYYNYKAATAGTISGSSNSTNATYDICPKGWRLPTYHEFYYELSGIESLASAFSPVYSGYYGSGKLYYTGSSGYWWSATADDSAYRYGLHYSGDSLGTGINRRYVGYSVRCIRSA